MSSSTSKAFVKVGAICMCGQLSVSAKVPTASLPLTLYLCHCTTCRHSTGQLCLGYIGLPEGYKSFEVTGNVERYKISEGVIRCFCGTCGSHVCEDSPDPNKRGFTAGAFQFVEAALKPPFHIFVADTLDGGLRDWMQDLPAWEGWHSGRGGSGSNQIPKGKPYSLSVPNTDLIDLTKKLHCYCHCGGVEFDVTRPNANSYKLSSPWSDSFQKNGEGSGRDNPEDVKWWICGKGTKYAAVVCACNSCRQSSGYDIQPWAFVPKTNLVQTNGDLFRYTIGTLQQYNSSEGTYRNFCGVCGATVFWHCDERPDLVDVSVGLMEAPSGARAEEWLEWNTDRVSFHEFGQNKPLIESLRIGMTKWGQSRKSN